MKHETISGEIITEAHSVRVIGASHPLRERDTDVCLPAGSTIAELIAIAADDRCELRRRFVVYLNGEPIPEHNWPRVRPKPGTTLSFRAIVAGRQFAQIGLVLAAIAATFIVGPWVVGALALPAGGLMAGLVTAGITAAVTVGGSLLINALYPVTPPQLAEDKNTTAEARRTTYSIGGGRNQARPFDPVPVVLGRHRMAPPYAAAPYTEIVGKDQYLRMLFVWGYGPLQISQIKIGETPIEQFDDVEIQTREGFPGDTPQTLYTRDVAEEQLSIELAPLVWQTRFTTTNITEWSIDVTAPNGIYRIEKATGAFEYQFVEFDIRYRRVGVGSFTVLGPYRMGGSKQETLRRGIRIAGLTAGQYQIEVRRLTAVYSGPDQVQDAIHWTAVRGIRNEAPIQFDKPVALTAIRIKATDQLNGIIDALNGRVESLGDHWNGSTWIWPSVSRNPASIFRNVLLHAANARPVPLARIDLASVEAWASRCAAKGYEYNAIIDNRRSVYSVLSDIAAAGRAAVVFKDGKWSIIYEDSDTNPPIVQHFTPRNSWGFRASRVYRRTPHAWRVRYINEDMAWQQDERIVYDDGYTSANATLYESIEFPGVTDSNLIWKHGRFHIAQVRLRPETFTIQTDFEHLVCTRGDRVRLTHDIPLIGQIAGRVTGMTNPDIIHLDEPVIMEAGKSYGIRFRRGSGDAVYHAVTTVVGEAKQVQLVDVGLGLPVVGDLFMFGEAGVESSIMRVVSIEPGDDLSATLTLVDDAPAIGSADTGTIPDYTPNITLPVDPLTLPPQDVRVSEYLYAYGSGSRAGATISWSVQRQGTARAYEVQMRDEGGDDTWDVVETVPAPKLFANVLNLRSAIYSFRVRTLFTDGTASAWVELLNVALHLLNDPPPDVDNFAVSILGDVATLTWDPVTVPNLSHYEIRFAPVTSGAVWSASSLIRTGIVGTTTQAPARVGTYLIKAVTHQGVYSASAAMIASNISALTNLNAVETLDEAPTFTGTHSGTTVVNGRLMLSTDSELAEWPNLSDVESMYLGAGVIGATGTYTFSDIVDLGAVYSSRVNAFVDASAESITNIMSSWPSLSEVEIMSGAASTAWSVEVQISTTNDNPAGTPTWSAWTPLVLAGDIEARAFRFRAILSSGDTAGLITPAVSVLSVTVDMPDRVIAGEDILVPTPGLTITFDPPFKEILGIARNDQDLQTGDYAVVTAVTASGFTIAYKNAAGSPVERTLDYVAKGYGRVITP